MRALILTKIFPNRIEPLSSPFNRQQFRELATFCDLEILAAIPWFPGAKVFSRWSRAGRLFQVPSQDRIDGLVVHHPRFVYVPKLPGLSGLLFAACMAKVVHRYRKRVDVILGSWAYPDGFAAVMLSRLLGVPAVIKLHGSDINVLAHMAGPRRGLRWALPRAERIVAVSHPLREAAIELGATSARIDVVRNGVDRACFHPKDRLAARRALGLPVDRAMVLCVSNVERHKGSLDLVRAMAVLAARRPDVSLVMVGDGTAMDECKRLSAELNVGISFVGARPHQEVSDWLTACDVFVLPSWNEGTPNVLLEALACGRRVVATRIGGIPDVVRSNTLGTLVTPADPAALAVAIEDALSTPYDPTVISTTLDVPDWRGSALRLHASLTAAVESYGHRAAA